MQLRLEAPTRRQLLIGATAAVVAGLGFAFRGLLLHVGRLTLGASALCFVAVPIARLYEKKLSRWASALAALLSIGIAASILLGLLLPPVYRQLTALIQLLPESIGRLADWLNGFRRWIQDSMPALALPEMDAAVLMGPLSGLAGGTVSLAFDLAEGIGHASMVVVLAFFFLCDRERLLLRLELLLPESARPTVIRMGNAVCRELRLYLQGQLLVAGAVSLLSVAALSLVGLENALALGLIIGLLNMIPYFGPFIGGAPAVLIALSDGWSRAALTLLALNIVQQLDGSWISPRIMGSLSGFSPGAVLVGIYAGARLGGVTGMLLALPAMMSLRTVFRIFVQKYENI